MAGRANGEAVALAVEGCTGWRYVVEEITAAGFEAHLAEPADTQAARGPKRRAKTDRSDAELLRELLQRGELPESWIPPAVVLEWRERAGSTSRWSINARCGPSGFMPNCSNMGCRCPKDGSVRQRPEPSWRTTVG